MTEQVDPYVTLTVQIAFASAPYDPAPVWTDVTGDVRAVPSITRGRNNELERFEAGRATVVLDNRLRRYDPSNTSSPYYPNLKVGRRIRIRATYLGVTYDRFDGFVDGWPQEYNQPHDAYVTVTASDILARLARKKIRNVVVEEYTLDAPLAFFPLDEPSGATAVGSRAGVWPSAEIVYGKGPKGAEHTLGDVALPHDDTITALDLTSHVTFTIGYVSDAGYVVQVMRNDNGPVVTAAGGFTVEFGFRTTESRYRSMLFIQHDARMFDSSGVFINAHQQVYFDISPDGYLAFGVAGVLFASDFSTPFNDGAWHHVAGVLSADGKTATLYVDGSVLVSASTGTAVTFARATHAVTLGGYYFEGFSGQYFTGSLVALGMTDVPLSAARVAAHAEAVTSGFGGEQSGARVNRILDYAGVPAALREIDAGSSPVQAQQMAGFALEALRKVEESEAGALYGGRDGKVRFRARWAFLTETRSTTSQATFGDQFLTDPAEVPYAAEGFVIDHDKELIRNAVTRSRRNGTTQEARDETSIDAHGEYTDDKTDLLVTSDSQLLDAANWTLDHYKDPIDRLPSLTLKPGRKPAVVYPQALGRDIGDRVTVKRTPPGGGPRKTIVALVEGVRESLKPGVWEGTTFPVSPADTKTYLMFTAGAGANESTAAWAY